MISVTKKVIAAVLTVFTLFVFATPTFAQIQGTAYTAETFKAPEAVTYTGLNSWLQSIPCFGIFVSLIPNRTCPAYDDQGNLIGVTQQEAQSPQTSKYSILGGLNTAMVTMAFNPPASSQQYLANLGADFGLIPRAQAQVSGSGSNVLRPVFVLWEVMRDLAYLGFILVFIVIGFMIMFRQRLNPQTVITVQSALPGLVVGLILVTFSYFIAALLIDLSFIVLQIVGGLFVSVGFNGLGNGGELLDKMRNPNLFDLWRVFTLNGNTINTISAPIIRAFEGSSGGITIQGLIIQAISTLTPAANVGQAFGGGASSLVVTILIIATIFQMIRLAWGLLQAYISIFLNTILGPIFILYSTLPGRRGALGFWWRNILGNAMIFPAVMAAFLFAGMIVATPAEEFSASMPLISFPTGLLRGILAFGIVLATPAIPKAVKGAFGVKEFNEFANEAMAGSTRGYQRVQRSAGRLVSPYAEERAGYSALMRKRAVERYDAMHSAPWHVSLGTKK